MTTYTRAELEQYAAEQGRNIEPSRYLSSNVTFQSTAAA